RARDRGRQPPRAGDVERLARPALRPAGQAVLRREPGRRRLARGLELRAAREREHGLADPRGADGEGPRPAHGRPVRACPATLPPLLHLAEPEDDGGLGRAVRRRQPVGDAAVARRPRGGSARALARPVRGLLPSLRARDPTRPAGGPARPGLGSLAGLPLLGPEGPRERLPPPAA